MQVTVKTTSNLGRELNVVVPSEQIEEKLSAKLKQLSAQVKMDGFRPGKIPVKVIQQRFGKAARNEIIGELLQNTLYEAILKENLKPAGLPEIESVKDEQGNPLEYTAVFDVYPSISLVDFSEINAEKVSVEITENDVNDTLENIRKQRTEWIKVTRASMMSDKLVIDFEGLKDDKPFEGNKGTDIQVILGSKTFIPGFEDGLINRTEGEQVELDLVFPDNYQVPDLKNAAVKFKVLIKEIFEPKLPELNEEFVKSMGMESGELAEFKSEIKQHMERELGQTIKTKQKNQVFEQLLEKHQFDVPASLVKTEMKNMLKQYLPKQEITDEQVRNVPDTLKEEAKRRVSIGLIVAEIIMKNSIKVDHDRVKAFILSISKAYEHPEQMIDWYYGSKERLANIEASVLEEQVYDKICESANLTEKKLNYAEVMNLEQKVI